MKNKSIIAVGGIGTIFLFLWFLFAVPELIHTEYIYEVSAENIGEI
ncbi:MAG: hypothetical protein J4F36_05110 [Nitrosopumilaceae archaeon]|nr:hypothetical protein [Nitrosopumilaceae archaeon]